MYPIALGTSIIKLPATCPITNYIKKSRGPLIGIKTVSCLVLTFRRYISDRLHTGLPYHVQI